MGHISNILGMLLNVQVESLKENSPYGLNNIMLIDHKGSMITNLRCIRIFKLQQLCLQLSVMASILEILYKGKLITYTSLHDTLNPAMTTSDLQALWESFRLLLKLWFPTFRTLPNLHVFGYLNQ